MAGAHGGAGASTLAALMQPAWDLGPLQPLLGLGRPLLRDRERPLVVVARNTVAAARHATNAVTALHQTGTPIAALVIVADGAGSEPRDATARFRLLQGRVGGIVRMPFISDLRLVDDATAIDLPRRVREALGALRALVYGRH